jgi:Ser/Thr protein kinase RdoA (MazF antagonist)
VRLAVVGVFEASFRNENWLVEDARGRRYVLRHNLQHAHGPRIAFQVRFQQHLRRHGFPTAEVVETRSGDLFILDGDGVPWVQNYAFSSLGAIVIYDTADSLAS